MHRAAGNIDNGLQARLEVERGLACHGLTDVILADLTELGKLKMADKVEKERWNRT